jgi:Tol biopolymer transport system component
VPATSDGLANGPAVLVAEISDPVAADQGTTVRADGKELLFQSTRAGGLGGNDLWTSNRRSVRDPWSTPVNLGAPMNTAAAEQQASLSGDGRTLVFATSRTGTLSGTDLWMSTRTRIGR